ncbi:MAG: class II SORL domain-containing protein [Planctomycetota bacterium]|jgi:superoxide reductase
MLTKMKSEPNVCAEDIFCGVNMVPDIDDATDLEKKHLPVISAPAKVQSNECFEVTIEVGKLIDHPNEPGHFIEFIELYAGETYLARMDFTAKTTCPTMKTCMSLDHAHGKLRAFARCNLHGTWENEVDIEVTQ